MNFISFYLPHSLEWGLEIIIYFFFGTLVPSVKSIIKFIFSNLFGHTRD